MVLKKSYVWIVLILGLISNSVFGQTPTSVEIVLTDGVSPTCAGNTIQVLADITWLIPPTINQSVFYSWTKSQASVNNGSPQFIGGSDDAFSFVREALTETTTYILQIGGVSSDPFTIVVNDPLRAGEDNPPVSLCNDEPFDLFVFVNGTPDTGGTWSPELASGTNIFDPTIDQPGIYDYTVGGLGPCPSVSSRIRVLPCGNDDFDNDTVDNLIDQDQDNDGIPDSIEDNLCVTNVIQLTPSRLAIDDNFGEGAATTSSFVSPLLKFESGIPQDDGTDPNSLDGEYVIATSRHIFDQDGNRPFELAPYLSTELNNHEDADGNQDGRFLAINMETGSFIDGIIYEQTNLPVTAGLDYTLSMNVVNLDSGGVKPNLTIEIVSTDNAGVETIEAFRDTGEIDNNMDAWQFFPVDFVPGNGVRVVTLRIRNRNTFVDQAGNDLGIDNIMLATLECDFDGDGIPNKIDLDSDNDGIYDAIEAGIDPSLIGSDGRLTGAVNGVGVSGNAITTALDTDGDGFPDYLDHNSDSADELVENCSDANEAYGNNTADGGDGGEYGVSPFDPADIVDFDGRVVDASYTDPIDKDGVGGFDFIQVGGPNACEDRDNDEDLVNDDVDLDDDNDGILDVNEYTAGITDDPLSDSNGTLLYLDTTNANFIDVNNDDVDDRFDFDLDGIINQFDVDSDNDGIYDHVEAGLALVIITDDYGQIGEDDDVEDTDVARLGLLEDAPLAPADFDNDGLPNFLDIDADGDGILDNYEAQPTAVYVAPSGVDADENGADDAYDNAGALNPVETTAGTPDYLNENSDDDCLSDTIEAYDVDQDGVSDTPPGVDANNDGLADGYEGTPLVAAFPNNNIPLTPEVDYRELYEEITIPIVGDPAIEDTICEDSGLYRLFDLIETFTSNENGLWTGGIASVAGESFDWELDPLLVPAGAGLVEYVYTLPVIGTCPESTFTVFIEVTPEPFTGLENLSAIPACSSDTLFSLYDNLLPDGTTLPDINGDWTSADTTVLPATYNGTIDLTTIPAALLGTDITFNYRVGSTTCFSDTDIVINLSSNREAGIADASIPSICITETSTDNLFTYLTDAEAGGTWSSTDDTVTDFTGDSLGVINPSLLAAGVYEYTYQLDAIGSCSPDDATVEITIIPEPFTGLENLSAIPACSSDTAFSLYNNLLPDGTTLPDINGDWTSADTTVLPATYDGTIDLTAIPAVLLGTDITFNYRVGSATCFSDTDIVINLSSNRNAGIADTSIPPICILDVSTDPLFTYLTDAEAGGTWSSTDDTVTNFTGDSLGVINPSSLTAGVYIYTYELAAIGSCLPDIETVEITISPAPNPGIDGIADVCSSTVSISLFDSLTGTPDEINGIWTNAAGQVIGTDYTGILQISTITTGDIFTYTVGADNCNDTSTVTVNITPGPNPGTSVTTPIVLCKSDTDVVPLLITYLGPNAEPGGTWEQEFNSVTTTNNGTIDLSMLDAGDYIFTYTLTGGTGPCAAISATVPVTITPELIASLTQADDILCRELNGDVDLSIYLDPTSTTGGTWSGGVITAAGILDFNTAAAGVEIYVYTVESAIAGGCVPVSDSIVITLTEDRDAGETPLTPLTICSNENDQVSLFDELDQGVDTDGDWEVSPGTIDPWTADIEGGHLGIVADGAEGLTPGNFEFIYTLMGEGSCEDATVSVNLIVLAAPAITFPINPVCSIDKETYDVDYVSNDTWDLTIAAKDGVSNIGNASVDVANSKIINIPEGVEIVLTARDSSGVVCEESFDVTPWSCPCDAIAAPVNLGDVLVCDGDINQQLSVSVDAGLSVNWYESDDTGFTNPVATNTLVFTPPADIVNVGGYTYNAVAFDVNAPKCISEPEPVLFTIFGIQPVDLEPQEFLCVDVNGIALQNEPLVIESEGRLGFTYQWYDANGEIPGETDADIIVNSPGTYFVVYESTRTNTVTGTTCSVTSSSTLVTPVVEPSLLPLSLGTGGFSEFNSITATLENGGDPNSEYEYDLDGEIFQESNVFENVSTGFHTVTVTDLNGCGTDTEEIYVIGFPKFFTPNGDSTNEFWNVDLDPNMPMDLNIFIYDRFGKLIQQVFPDRAGWDGTFAGKNMPSDDYWFIATMNETGETFASHFSLIR